MLPQTTQITQTTPAGPAKNEFWFAPGANGYGSSPALDSNIRLCCLIMTALIDFQHTSAGADSIRIGRYTLKSEVHARISNIDGNGLPSSG